MPISQNTYTVPNNFVQQYDLGQKKIRADLVDENFTDAAGAINTLLTSVATNDAAAVHLTGAETISGNKTFSGNNTFSGTNAFSGTTTAVTKSAGDNSTNIATTAYVDAAVAALETIPVGTILWSGKSSAPTGFLLCNGSAVSRTTYAALFAAIGTTFGSGNGSTTFNLPNLIDKFIEGSTTAGTVKAAGVPNIEGNIKGTTTGSAIMRGGTLTGAFKQGTTSSSSSLTTGAATSYNLLFDASLSNSIYGASSSVQPPAVTAVPYIKY